MAAAAARVARWHAWTEVRKTTTTKTIPTMAPVAGNHTEPVQIQLRVAMEEQVGMPSVKVSHFMLYIQAVVLTGAYVSAAIRHKSLCPEKLPRYLR